MKYPSFWVSESCICILLIIQLFGSISSITTGMMLPSYFDFVVDIFFVTHLTVAVPEI